MYQIQVNGDTEESVTHVDELDGLSVQLSINEDGFLDQWRCSNCGEESGDDAPDESCEGSGSYLKCFSCRGSHACEDCSGKDTDCPNCDGTGECPDCDNDGDIEVHDWERIPFHWINSASIHVENDHVDVTISVGDPRGAFVMRLERHSDGELRLSVPHERMALPHMPLQQRGPGFFKVGH